MLGLLQLFITFLMIGFVSFGGGYAMIPLMQAEVVNRYGWLTMDQFTDVVAVAGMSPGPIATNMAVSIGYMYMGITGTIVATVAMILPSLLCVVLLAVFFKKLQNHPTFNASMYGIRSVVTGFIIYSAIIFAQNSGMMSKLSWFTMSQILIFLGSLISLMYFKKHPVYIIIISGLIGVALYS